MQEQKDLLTNELEITDTLKKHFIDIAGWARLLSVISIIACVLMLTGAVFTEFYISRLMANRYGFSIGSAISALYVFFAAIWFLPSILLYSFSIKLSTAVKNNIQENIDEAFIDLKSLLKFMGIGTMIVLLLWIVSFLTLFVKTL